MNLFWSASSETGCKYMRLFFYLQIFFEIFQKNFRGVGIFTVKTGIVFWRALREAQRPTPDPEPIEGAGRNDKKEMKTK